MRKEAMLFAVLVAVLALVLFVFMVMSGCGGDSGVTRTMRPSVEKAQALGAVCCPNEIKSYGWDSEGSCDPESVTATLWFEAEGLTWWRPLAYLYYAPIDTGCVFRLPQSGFSTTSANWTQMTDSTVVWIFESITVPGGGLYVRVLFQNVYANWFGQCMDVFYIDPNCPPPGGGGKGDPSG